MGVRLAGPHWHLSPPGQPLRDHHRKPKLKRQLIGLARPAILTSYSRAPSLSLLFLAFVFVFFFIFFSGALKGEIKMVHICEKFARNLGVGESPC